MASHFSIRFFGSSKPLQEEQSLFIKQELDDFLKSWNSHGTPLNAKVDVLFQRWVCIVADEEQEKAGGCSLDRLYRKVQDISEELKVNLTDRTLLTYLKDNIAHTVHFQDFIKSVKEDTLSLETPILDTTMTDYEHFVASSWIPAKDSWLKTRLSNS